MLVLSRRQDEKVCFPNLGIEVQVIRTGGKVIRLGVVAPPEVPVLRGELLQSAEIAKTAENTKRLVNGPAEEALKRFRHDVRDRLNVACLGLQVLQRRIDAGRWDEVESLIQHTLRAFQTINDELANCESPAASAMKQTPHVLIVEDNANEGQLLAELLGSYGCDAAVVANGRQALDHLRKNGKPDFVLMDMNMPELDGPATIRMLREQSEFDGLRVYAVSGMERYEAGVSLGPGGVDRWYTKPINARRLAQELVSAPAVATPIG
ncbi:Polar-differentiation response regulator DivK [Anatilimnocola aggregata]|uniref:Translational regulator CsrA n=1 Tax=Anatilimnocola aggregata TaxID=2528021 RepID=A0A517Y9Y8_9BACT|nr:response regulator [Anatilimnocola aggregata]QDU27055.1 Polar-differentiation response regulator DivK [Anatilimnocola aggregata]